MYVRCAGVYVLLGVNEERAVYQRIGDSLREGSGLQHDGTTHDDLQKPVTWYSTCHPFSWKKQASVGCTIYAVKPAQMALRTDMAKTLMGTGAPEAMRPCLHLEYNHKGKLVRFAKVTATRCEDLITTEEELALLDSKFQKVSRWVWSFRGTYTFSDTDVHPIHYLSACAPIQVSLGEFQKDDWCAATFLYRVQEDISEEQDQRWFTSGGEAQDLSDV
jgi:hypothetical protein